MKEKLQLNKASIFHQSSYCYCYAADENSLYVRLKAEHGALANVTLCYKDLYDHSRDIASVNMPLLLTDGVSDMYEARISLKSRRFKYYFELTDCSGRLYNYGSDGFSGQIAEADMFYYPYVNPDEIFNFPRWARGASIYQVLIDRFFDGDPSNNPKNCKPRGHMPDRNTYYGGDFAGITEKLDYLVSIGADILYLSPLLKSPTYHKYDVADYLSIDGIYGTREELIQLVRQARGKGIRVILDCVFNHCSSKNPIFSDVVQNGEKSRYKDWFCLNGFPVDEKECNYDCFGGLVPSMPRFNTSNPEVIDYLTGIALYWTKELDIDGWRLDVADEVSHLLWKTLRTRLLDYKPDLLIIGEIWNQATQWLDGTEMHTVTNYKFRRHLLDLASGAISAEDFWNKYNYTVMLYKTPAKSNLVNLVGSHDTARTATLLKNERLALCALIAMLTFEGMPLTYYGDEIALQGGEDPDNRRAMDWTKLNSRFASEYRRVAKYRQKSGVLRYGDITKINTEGSLLAFVRTYRNKKILIAINFGEQQEFIYCNKHFSLDACGYMIKEM